MSKLSDKFYIYTGSKLDFGKQEIDINGINFVSRNSNNNGVVARVELKDGMKIYKKGDISVPLGGSFLLSAFVQNEDFVTAQNVDVLRPKEKMSDIEKWFYCYVLRVNRFKFSAFGREVNKYIHDIEIPDKIPDWVYKHELKLKQKKNTNVESVQTTYWKYFKLRDLFFVSGTHTTSLTELENIGEGKYPYVTTQAKNNGVAGYYNYWTEEGNVLTIDSAVLGYCTYQEFNFSASDHVEKLTPKFKMNKYIALFFVTLINMENFRYNYGRKFNQLKIKNCDIKLPVKEDGKPDFEYMENYMKNLPYGDLLDGGVYL